MDDDGKERGIFFIFLSAKAPETFEFLKREWINTGNFLGLGTEEDPIAGEHVETGMFTIPMKPIRRRLQGMERFTVTRGGEYGFVPSLSALRWLASSPAERATASPSGSSNSRHRTHIVPNDASTATMCSVSIPGTVLKNTGHWVPSCESGSRPMRCRAAFATR